VSDDCRLDELTLAIKTPAEFVERVAERAAELVLAHLKANERALGSPFLSVHEAADYLRAKPQRVYDLLSAGRLQRFKDGRRVLVARAELDAYLADVRPNRIAPVLPLASRRRVAMRSAA
jgi:excisionase family DNA binding protein